MISISVAAQTKSELDTLAPIQLEEIIIRPSNKLSQKGIKPLSTLDEYLDQSNSINMLRRGSYAWEPLINGMASERSVITIDGMRIYGACTDKMDPTPSYVEITNLSKAHIHSGPSNSSGASIAGSLNLERKKGNFTSSNKLRTTVLGGYETNNQQKTAGGAISYASSKFFSDIDFTYRDAENYRAGDNKKVLNSQFTKYNVSAIIGYKLNERHQIEASIIYDHATDVGYPALPMDVSTAKAIITSVEYIQHHISPHINKWQTKLYFNDITHIMDDTQRPDVPIRMDMPGWSKTIGFYSLLQGRKNNHNWKINLSGHHNQSLAEMTMFSNNPNEKDMFMLTWPDVHTNYADLFAENKLKISNQWFSNLSIGIAVHNNQLNSQFGLESMRIFYPEMNKSKTRILKRLANTFEFKNKNWNYHLGLAYGERAPSISEGYGFYLFNSSDRYDYIGNPEMKNEKTVSFSTGISFSESKFLAQLSGTFFHIYDYIIGKKQDDLNTMTIGAEGVKVYEQLKYAQILNLSFDTNYQISNNLNWSNNLSYRNATGENIKYLPFIQPFMYNSRMIFSINNFSTDLSINGAVKQNKVNADLGEQKTPAYWIANFSASNRFHIGRNKVLVKLGIENMFDKNYTTFADWNKIPRMGRNFFLNIVYDF